jgi:hypothetical protein
MKFEIVVHAKSPRAAGTLAKDIADSLRGNGVPVEGVPSPLTQDLGATLILVLGTAAAVEVAKGIADRLRRDRSSSIKLTNDRGESIEVSGISEDAATSIQLFLSRV